MTDRGERIWEIEELLHRRSDLSTFVIHWTRQYEGVAARDNLVSVLKSRTIEARNPMGAGVQTLRKLEAAGTLSGDSLKDALDSQRVVCFTEAPLEQAWSFICNISGRQNQLEPLGLAFRKEDARRMGINPVWYVDMTPGRYWLTHYVENLVRRAADQGKAFADDPISKIAPFIEGMGTWPGLGRKEFWWEREWRHLGDLSFSLT